VGSAQNGDTVIVQPGTYSVTYNVTTDKAITLEGEPGQPRPSLVGASNLSTNTVTLSGGATVSHLDIEATNTNPAHHLAALSVAGGLAEDLTLFAGPGDSQGEALLVNDSAAGTIVRNVLARSQAPGGAAVAFQDATQPPGTASVYSLTASAESPTTSAVYGNMAKGSALIKDSILLAQGKGIQTNAATGPIDVSYSDFPAPSSTGYVDQGGNISAAPVFVDAASGNFHEAATSPTIDAGVGDLSLSSTDLDGNLRTLGDAPDMGAYEFIPSTVAPSSGSSGPPPPLAPVVPLSSSQPVFGVSVVLTALSGTVLVQAPHTKRFVPLSAAADVPVGSTIDATHGVVALTSAIGRSGASRTGDFRGGKFVVGQSTAASGRTELRLAGGSFAGCQAPSVSHTVMARAARSRRRRHRVVRQLWGSDSGGKFTTIGNSASAAVRGTVWLTQDRCDGTLVKVFRGHVVVRDRRRHRTVVLGPGQSYLARARR
jgi:hypothetical protein